MPFDRLDRALIGAARAHRRRAAELLAPIGLHPGQEVLLGVLRRRASATQVQLARILGVEPPTLAVMVRRLEAAGFVTRSADAGDARVKLVTLTEHGRAAADRADEALGSLSRASVDVLGADDALTLSMLLEKLAQALSDAGDDSHT